MDTGTCTVCHRRLRAGQFASDGKRGKKRQCVPCATEIRKLANPLPPIPVDLVQVRINNTFNLWHGPVSRVPLRYAA